MTSPSFASSAHHHDGATELDALTGLLTRAGLLRRLRDLLEGGREVAIFAVDLDRFKWVNDSAGMQVGDEVLRVAGTRLGLSVRALTTSPVDVARVSADEFAIVVEGADVAIHDIARQLLATMRESIESHGTVVTLTASVGIAESVDAHDPDSLMRAASIALHRAENDGGDCWQRYEPWMLEMASSRQSLESAFRDALVECETSPESPIGAEQFEVHFQPQVSMQRRRLEGFEALVRWRHPSLGLVAPDEFIPLAESTGLIAALGDLVLRTACLAAVQWPATEGSDALQVAVNVSPLQLRDRDALVASISRALDESGLAPERLEIEITESALNRNALAALEQIKSLGVQLALDDFGSGYSSLSQLAQYPFDRLKIDRSFVRDLRPGASRALIGRGERRSSHAEWMIQAIASLGAGLRLSTIAEGIETEGQAEIVRQAGVSSMQGFLISKAIPADQVHAWIEQFKTMPKSPQLMRLA